MLYTEIVSDIQNNFCAQHVLPMFCKKEELLTKIYLYRLFFVAQHFQRQRKIESFEELDTPVLGRRHR